MTELDLLAEELGVSGRTLRRAASRGLVRGMARTSRGYRLPAGERRYLRGQWPTLGRLLGLLRTEPNVRLGVIFGSLARGDARPESDVDLLVRLAHGSALEAARLSLRLSEALDREVQVVLAEDADRTPLLLRDVLREGRVLVDRDGEWARLLVQEPAIQHFAQRDDLRLEHAAWKTLESLGSPAT